MITKRIIPCLDMTKGRVVKGVQFKTFRDAGDSVEFARFYSEEGADELVFLDITATTENRDILIDVVSKTARAVSLPFTVGGGIRTIADARAILLAGADKVSINTGGFTNPELIQKAAERFGSQSVVVGVDVKKISEDRWNVFINGGTTDTGVEARVWIARAVELGAGEVLLTSIDRDGTKAGYDTALVNVVAETVPIPIIASGGAGSMEDIRDVLLSGADAALLASLFHFGDITVRGLKQYLKKEGIAVRL